MNIETAAPDPALESCFRALSDRLRLRILLLLEEGEICVGDLVKALQAPQAKVSQHLGYLQRAGLVAVRRRGLWRFYRLDESGDPWRARLLACLFACRSALPEAEEDGRRRERLRAEGACCPLG